MAIKLKTQIIKAANRYVIHIPKTYVDDGNLNMGEEYDVVIVPRKKEEDGLAGIRTQAVKVIEIIGTNPQTAQLAVLLEDETDD